jgi:hypothetical protein
MYAGHVARMGKIINVGVQNSDCNLNRRDYLEDLGVEARIILKCIVEI